MSVATDMGSGNPQAVDANGNVIPMKKVVSLSGTPDELNQLAKAARYVKNPSLADRIDAVSGKKSKLNFIERHPVTTGALAVVAGIGVGTGVFFGGRAIIRKRRAAKLTAGPMRMVPPPASIR